MTRQERTREQALARLQFALARAKVLFAAPEDAPVARLLAEALTSVNAASDCLAERQRQQ